MTKSSVFFSFVSSYSYSPNPAVSSLPSETILVFFFAFLPFLDLVLVVKTVVDKFFLSSSYYNLEASIASKASFCSSMYSSCCSYSIYFSILNCWNLNSCIFYFLLFRLFSLQFLRIVINRSANMKTVIKQIVVKKL